MQITVDLVVLNPSRMRLTMEVGGVDFDGKNYPIRITGRWLQVGEAEVDLYPVIEALVKSHKPSEAKTNFVKNLEEGEKING